MCRDILYSSSEVTVTVIGLELGPWDVVVHGDDCTGSKGDPGGAGTLGFVEVERAGVGVGEKDSKC